MSLKFGIMQGRLTKASPNILQKFPAVWTKEFDFIKSDIEGYEDQLIDDLPKIVKKFRPKLAISIYHSNLKSINSIQQLVSLPIKLFKICKNYKFFIRHYSFSRKETVMYCIPK